MSILEVMRYHMKKYLLLLFYLLLASLNLNLILKPLNLVTGGTQGLALILSYITNLSPSLLILIINIITIIISFFFLTKDHTKSALISTFIYPLFIKLTSYIPNLNINNNFFIVIISGLIYGFTSGMIYKLGFSSGGITIINLLINKYLNIKLSVINFITNFIIILLGYLLFGLNKSLSSLLLIIIGSIVINLILTKKKKVTHQ